MFSPNEAFYLQWHITDCCNLSCAHCYRDSIKSDLSLPQLKNVFSNFQRLRVSMHQKKARVQIAGGEPLLSEHIFSILDLISGAGFQSRILTNGTLVDSKIAKEIKSHGCRVVQISIDGAKITHDAIRGEGSFERAIEGAKFLREQKVEVTFSMTLSRQNVAQIKDVFEIARQNAQRVSFHRLVPCGRSTNLRAQLLGNDEIKKAFEEIWHCREVRDKLEVPLRDPLWKPFTRRVDVDPYVDGCSIGYGGICVESNGDVYPCRRMPVRVGNALSDELLDVWHSQRMVTLRNRDLLKGRCGSCPLRWKCGGCRAIGWAVSDDMFAEDPQCFYRASVGEKVAYKLLNSLNRKFYLEDTAGGA